MRKRIGIKKTWFNIFLLFVIGLLIGLVIGLRQPVETDATPQKTATVEVEKK